MRRPSAPYRAESSVRKITAFACFVLLLALVAAAQQNAAPTFTVKAIPLPGANGLVMLDYVAYDKARGRLWVPAGNMGSVDVINGSTGEIKQVPGFSVAQVQLRGKSLTVGPSSVAIERA